MTKRERSALMHAHDRLKTLKSAAINSSFNVAVLSSMVTELEDRILPVLDAITVDAKFRTAKQDELLATFSHNFWRNGR